MNFRSGWGPTPLPTGAQKRSTSARDPGRTATVQPDLGLAVAEEEVTRFVEHMMPPADPRAPDVRPRPSSVSAWTTAGDTSCLPTSVHAIAARSRASARATQASRSNAGMADEKRYYPRRWHSRQKRQDRANHPSYGGAPSGGWSNANSRSRRDGDQVRDGVVGPTVTGEEGGARGLRRCRPLAHDGVDRRQESPHRRRPPGPRAVRPRRAPP